MAGRNKNVIYSAVDQGNDSKMVRIRSDRVGKPATSPADRAASRAARPGVCAERRQ
jgi:hypothetical protein